MMLISYVFCIWKLYGAGRSAASYGAIMAVYVECATLTSEFLIADVY